MARNSSGTYSLPASVNPVTTATTITSAWANTTLPDIAAEITDSLSRSGEGAMLAPLRVPDGSLFAPSVTFDSDQNTGLYRSSADAMAAVAGGTAAANFSAGALTAPGTLAVTGASTMTGAVATQAGITATQSTVNGAAVTGTGNGTGTGVVGTGGGTDGAGLVGTGGATNGTGVYGVGTGTGRGLHATGGSGGGPGLRGLGGGTAAGGQFANGTAATAATPQNAVELENGNLKLSGANPNSTVAFTNTLTPMNVPKAWAFLQTNGAGGYTLYSAFNIASITIAAGYVELVTASNVANASAPYVSDGSNNAGVAYHYKSWCSAANTFRVSGLSISTVPAVSDLNMSTGTHAFSFLLFGAQ